MRPTWKADADFQPLREVLIQQHLASRRWTTPQRQWLQRISNKTKAITIVDREELDDDLLYFGPPEKWKNASAAIDLSC